MDRYRIYEGKKLKCGYTTGTCAAAAAKAATDMLLLGRVVTEVNILTPKGIDLLLAVEDVRREPNYVSCAVRKDAGDDPDDTDGMLIYARAEKTEGADVIIQGGPGVGLVTKPGLSCAVGGPAINPVPRRMITEAVRTIMNAAEYTGGINVTIEVSHGDEVAQKTFNPRLGIIGGLSILGTTGIVEPMSETALIDTFKVEMDVQKSRGNKDLLVFFGNYGQDFARDVLGLNINEAVICSNYVGELLDYAVYLQFRSVLLIGHAGKLVKLAQGVMNTHSKYADCRTEILALNAMLAGAPVALGQSIVAAPTTDEAVKLLREYGYQEEVFNRVMDRIAYYMQQRVHGKLQTGAIIFSNVYGVLGQTAAAAHLIRYQTNPKEEQR